MCIIIVKPAGQKLPADNVLRAAARLNSDGYGLMTSSGVSFHSLDLELFLRVVRHLANESEDVALHFRFATHGSISLKNCHPFTHKGEILLMHNGVLPINSKNNMTDSEIYLHKIGNKLIHYGLSSYQAGKLLNQSGSKFAVCDVKKHIISLFGDFQHFGGCWFSNMRPFIGGLSLENGIINYRRSNYYEYIRGRQPYCWH